jgi:hypothetical protein
MKDKDFEKYLQSIEELLKECLDCLKDLSNKDLDEDEFLCECGNKFIARGDISKSTQCWSCHLSKFKEKI